MTVKKVIALIIIALCLFASDSRVLTPADKALIEAVIQRWYELSNEASINGGDVSQFPEVLINTSDYPLDAKHRKYIADILGPDAVPGAGFLTAMQAQYKNLGEGWTLYKIAINTANQENRKVTRAEMDEIVKAMHGEIPPIVDERYSKVQLTFTSFDLTREGRAIVRFGISSGLQELTLVRIDDRWFICCGRTLKVSN